MKNISIAMLGSGFVADFYMQGLSNVKDQEVVANFSRDAARARDFAARWGIPEPTADLEALIARDDLALFIIALPNEAHLPVSLALSRAKRNQVCTKPLARNRTEARAMLDAAAQSGAMHGYAETEVFAPCVVKAREIVERGAIGRVLWVRSRESHSGPHSAHFWDIEKTGGGAMNDLGCHCIEAARYFFGKQDPITDVLAWGAAWCTRTRPRARTTPCCCCASPAEESATASSPGPPRAVSTCATRSTARTAPFSPT